MDKNQTSEPNQPTSLKQLPKPNGFTIGQKVKFILFAIFFVVAIGGWLAYTATQNSANDDLMKNGVKASGISTGKYNDLAERHRRSSSTIYHAQYEYLNQQGKARIAYGEKDFDSTEDIKVGMKATVYYDPNDASKGTYVVDEE